MSLIKRLSATVFARVDESVRQLQNHDAVITATLNETNRKVAQAKVRLNRVISDGDKLQKRLDDTEKMANKWALRACEKADVDQAVALDCVRRRNACQEETAQLKFALQKHKQAQDQLQSNLHDLQQRSQKITQQRNIFRTRQSSAEVNRCLQEIEGLGSIDIDDTFDCWEQKILEDEFINNGSLHEDKLEKDFINHEEQLDLEAELQALLDAKESKNE